MIFLSGILSFNIWQSCLDALCRKVEKNRKYIYAAELLRLVSLMSLPGLWPLPCTAPGPGYSNLSPGRERIIM